MRKYAVFLGAVLLLAACQYGGTPTPDPCTLTPIREPYNGELTVVNVYMEPYASSFVFSTLAGTTEATIRTVDGFYGISAGGVAQAGNCGIYRLRWVLKTQYVETSPGCENIPTVVGPLAGICYAMTCTSIPVYSEPATNSTLITTLDRDAYVMVVRREGDWLRVDLSIGSAGMDSLGYIQDQIGGLKGDCSGL